MNFLARVDRFKVWIYLTAVVVLGSCAQKPVVYNNTVAPMDESQYTDLVAQFTRATQNYDGFHQTFAVHLTWLNSQVTDVLTRRRAHYLGWDQQKLRQDRDFKINEQNTYANAFLAFFSPENQHDDLNKANSIWKIYLESGGKRIEGKIKRSSMKFVESKNLFPHFDRFKTGYDISFPIPMSVVEKSPAKIILTSSLGSAIFDFPALP